jgi:hypothetical protein
MNLSQRRHDEHIFENFVTDGAQDGHSPHPSGKGRSQGDRWRPQGPGIDTLIYIVVYLDARTPQRASLVIQTSL